MKRSSFLALLAAVVLLAAVSPAFGFPFSADDATAVGLGGAEIAAGAGITGVLANPASLSTGKTVELAFPAATFRADDLLGVRDALDRIDAILGGQGVSDWAISHPADRQRLVDLLISLDQAGRNGVDFGASGMVGVAFPAWGVRVGIGYSDQIYASAIADVDSARLDTTNPVSPDFIGNNQSGFLLKGLEAKQAVFSVSKELGGVAVGVNLRQVKGTAYVGSESAFSGTSSFEDFWDAMKHTRKETTLFAFDAGMQTGFLLPGLRVGVSGRNLNSPRFDFPDGSTWTARPQVRAGAAWDLGLLRASADLDLTSSESFTPGARYREAALGAEFSLWLLRLRAGVSRNLAWSGAPTRYHAGAGLRLLGVDLDVAGATDSSRNSVQAALNLALRF